MANEISSATRTVSAPPKPRPPERDRAAEFRTEQQQQQQRVQRQTESNRPKEPVVNPQGQTTGRILNEKA